MVSKNIFLDPFLVLGGGATEMSIAHYLRTKSKSISGKQQFAYASVADALEVIPRTLATNCGVKTIRVITQLRAKHAENPVQNACWGIDGSTGNLANIKTLNIWEPSVVKAQSIKTAIEASIMLLRVDQVVSGSGKKKASQPSQLGGAMEEQE
jgi:T-complex protein 1 subunit gamma